MSKKKPDPNQQPIKLSAEQMEMIREGDEAFERGEGVTLAEAREIANKRTLAWLKTHQTA